MIEKQREGGKGESDVAYLVRDFALYICRTERAWCVERDPRERAVNSKRPANEAQTIFLVSAAL